jgi:hypothetical protein
MPQNDQAEPRWTGRDLYDVDGHKIGTIDEVRYGDEAGTLAWLIVDPGLFSTKKLLIPANDVRTSESRLSVPYSKERIERAPEAQGGAALTDKDQAALCRYYGLVHPPAGGQVGEGCEDMPDVRPAG